MKLKLGNNKSRRSENVDQKKKTETNSSRCSVCSLHRKPRAFCLIFISKRACGEASKIFNNLELTAQHGHEQETLKRNFTKTLVSIETSQFSRFQKISYKRTIFKNQVTRRQGSSINNENLQEFLINAGEVRSPVPLSTFDVLSNITPN